MSLVVEYVALLLFSKCHTIWNTCYLIIFYEYNILRDFAGEVRKL